MCFQNFRETRKHFNFVDHFTEARKGCFDRAEDGFTRANYPPKKRAMPRASWKQSWPPRAIKEYRFPSSASENLLLLEEKRRKLCFQNSQRKAQVALSWPKKDEKGFIWRANRKEDGEVRSVGHIFNCFAVKVQVETPEHLDLLSF